MNKFEVFINSKIPIRKELKEIFKKEGPMIIFDIGACEGEDSIRYNRLFGNALIYSFEPIPDNYNKCIKNFEKYSNGNIKAFQLALCGINGYKIFYVSSSKEGINESDWDYGNKSSSLYPPDPSYKQFDWIEYNRQIDVKTQTIESFCNEQSIPRIDFIHLDVQGAELDVLKGSGIQLDKLKAIWLEVENISMYLGQPLKKDIESFMQESNFFKIIDTATGDFGDQLYLNSSYFSKFSPIVLRIRFIRFIKVLYLYLVPKQIKIKLKKLLFNSYLYK